MTVIANETGSFEALTFGLGGEIFALDADTVREILDVVPVTEVPEARSFVRGLINVRGKVVPLADLRVQASAWSRPPTIDTRIVVIEIDLAGEPPSSACWPTRSTRSPRSAPPPSRRRRKSA